MEFVRYEKTKGDETYVLQGLEEKKGFIFEMISFNEFKKKPKEIPKGYKKVKVEPSWVLKYTYDPDKTVLEKDNEIYQEIQKKHSQDKAYFTHDNGGRPFIVYISPKQISVYREVQNKYYVRETDRDRENNHKDAWLYIEHVVTKDYLKVWIGESISNKTTTFVCTDNDEFHGSCILVKTGPSRYLFIGEGVCEFSTDEEIDIFYAPVGNNDVPYSYAIGKKYVYFMREMIKVPISAFKEFTEEVQRNAYDSFYEDNLEEKGIPFEDINEIQPRLY